ncbi:MAG: hypothetical protein NVS3B20_21580 [Polyangiales bacterium]
MSEQGDGPAEFAAVLERAAVQLRHVLGEFPARKLIEEVSKPLRGPPQNADDLMVIATGLMLRGGFTEVVGRSLRAHALMRGSSW